MSGFTDADVPDQSGKTFIVTGANTGIGFGIASTLPARRLRAAGTPVTAVACHPGLAGTNLARDSWWGNIAMSLIGLFFNTPAQGAWGALQAATGRIKSGGYYGPTKISELRGPSGECTPSPDARNPELARRLWDVSVQLTGINAELPSNS